MKTIIFIISTVAMAYGITQLSYDLELSAGYMLAAIIGYYCLIVLSGNKKQLKKKAAKVVEPYTIEGKSIKQLVEENLGVEVETRRGTGFICGYSISKDTITVGLNDDDGWLETNEEIYSKYKSYWNLCDDDEYKNAITAIKKHRNML